jgi:hypothetical protein
MKKQFIIKLSLVLFILLIPFTMNSLSWKEIIQKYGLYVCFIEIKDSGSGSGFLISKDGKILTNSHVVKDAFYGKDNKISIKFSYSKNPDKEYFAKIENYSEDLDLSIIKIDENFPSFCPIGDSSKTEYMDEILVLGYPLGKNFKSTPGFIQSIQDIPEIGKMFDMNASVDPGNSGGPVFNNNGEVIGIVTSKYIGYNFNLAIPINVAKNYFDNVKNAKTIIINSNPSSARLFVNGRYKGNTPFNLEILGQDLEISIESDGYQVLKQKIPYSVDNNKIYNFDLLKKEQDKRTIVITTNPKDADVYLDNDLKGKTPLEITVIGDSSYRLKIHKFGYQDIFQEITTYNQKTLNLDFQLKK